MAQYKFPNKFSERDVQKGQAIALNALFASLYRLEMGSLEHDELAQEKQIGVTSRTILDGLRGLQSASEGIDISITIGEIE